MKKLLIAILALASVVALAACGSSAAQSATGNIGSTESAVATGQSASATQLTNTYQNALPVVSQLILGSLRLQDSDQAIDAAEAGQILPLWQAYQSLSNSDTTAPAELEALVKQIENTMKPEQIAAIAAMQLTNDSIAETLQSMGPGMFQGGGPVGDSSSSASSRGAGGGGFTGGPPGGFAGGGPGGDGGAGGFAGGPGGGFGGEQDPAARETAIAERMAQSGDQVSTFMTRGLLNQLITALQLKTGEVTQADLDAQQAQRNVFRWLQVAADTTGIPVETLQEALAGGSTLADAIKAQGGDVDAVETAIRDALKNNPDLDEQTIDSQINAVLNTAGVQIPQPQ